MNMEVSIFPKLSIDRAEIHWESILRTLTPVEQVEGIYFKRDDRFAPLGYGGINGSKLRQCINLISHRQAKGIVSGASVRSPQLSMVAAVAKHYGLPVILVLGATKVNTALEHENVAIAARLGAKFVLVKVGFNPVIQRRVQELLSNPACEGYYKLSYGIALGADESSPEQVEEFYQAGAEQVQNLPNDMKHLVIPAGSCNSAISILYGIAKYPPASLKTVWLIGIGPPKIDFLEERLGLIEQVAGINIRSLFYRHYPQWPEKAEKYNQGSQKTYNLYYDDLHTTKYTSYDQNVRWKLGSIIFHPTYEGKVMKRLSEKWHRIMNEETCIWIVGSKSTWKTMEAVLPATELPGELPCLNL